MIGRMFQRRGNQLVEVTNPSVILADTSNLVQGNTAPVYVNADTGDDVNDGMTANTAVKTIGKALELAKRREATDATEGSGVVQIIIAGGTYVEDIVVTTAVHFIAQAPVTIDGQVDVYSNAGLLHFVGTNSFTITTGLGSYRNALVKTDAPVFITGWIHADQGGIFVVEGSLTVNDNRTTGVAVSVSQSAVFLVSSAGTLNITGSGSNAGLVHVYNCGVLMFGGNSNVNLTANNTVNAIRVAHNGVLAVYASVNMTFSGSTTDVVIADFGGSVWIDVSANLSGNITGRRFLIGSVSSIWVVNTGPNRIPGTQPGFVYPNAYGVYF